MTDDALWRWDASRLAEAIARREVSAREAVESVLDRLDHVNPKINAVVESRREESLAAADQADLLTMSGEPLGALHGVPVTTKINIDQRGYATTNGISAFKDLIAQFDSPAVGSWRKAGAVFIGRTNAPALSLRWFTDNAPHGLTLNPWNPMLNVGGSSGGAAAAVATGVGALAHGNDLAGSVRLPASACGVYGLRPTTGRIAGFNATARAERSLGLQLGSTQGVLARCVRDIRLGLQTMSAGDHRDPAWTPAPLDHPADRDKVRIAVFAGDAQFPIAPPVAAALRQAAKWLAEAGYEVEEAAPPTFGEAADLWMTLLSNEAREPGLSALVDLTDSDLGRSQALTAQCLPRLSAEEMLAVLTRRVTLQRTWQDFLHRYPLLLTPTVWSPPFPLGYDLRGIDEARELLRAHSPLTATAFLGMPAISVPITRTTEGPIGVQLVASRFRDGLCLAAAEALERFVGKVLPIDPHA